MKSAWNLNLQKTGCSEFIYYSEQNARTRYSHEKFIYKESDPNSQHNVNSTLVKLPEFRKVSGSTDSLPTISDAVKKLSTAIEDHYRKQNNSKNNRIYRNSNDSLVVLSFAYKKTPPGESSQPFLFCSIPQNPKHFMRGDLNADKRADLLIPVKVSPGGAGHWNEFFLFIQDENGNYNFSCMASGYDLAIHARDSYSGQFFPGNISDQHIIGTSLSYRDEDPSCCPSVKIPTGVRFDDNRLQAARLSPDAAMPGP